MPKKTIICKVCKTERPATQKACRKCTRNRDRMPRVKSESRKKIEANMVRWGYLPPPLGMVDTFENRKRIVDCVMVWLRTCAANGRKFPDSLERMQTEMDHSALLSRLLHGKAPLPEPPPLSFSYPWYELIDEGQARPVDVWESRGTWAEKLFGKQTLVVNQTRWRIVKRPKEGGWIVKHARARGLWRVWRDGEPDPDNNHMGNWRMQKLEEKSDD